MKTAAAAFLGTAAALAAAVYLAALVWPTVRRGTVADLLAEVKGQSSTLGAVL